MLQLFNQNLCIVLQPMEILANLAEISYNKLQDQSCKIIGEFSGMNNDLKILLMRKIVTDVFKSVHLVHNAPAINTLCTHNQFFFIAHKEHRRSRYLLKVKSEGR